MIASIRDRKHRRISWSALTFIITWVMCDFALNNSSRIILIGILVCNLNDDMFSMIWQNILATIQYWFTTPLWADICWNGLSFHSISHTVGSGFRIHRLQLCRMIKPPPSMSLPIFRGWITVMSEDIIPVVEDFMSYLLLIHKHTTLVFIWTWRAVFVARSNQSAGHENP